MRRTASTGLSVVVVAAVAAIAFAVSGSGPARSAEPSGSPSSPAGWQGLLGLRPVPQLGDREIVVLKLPSLADRVRAAGGVATEVQERAWTREAQKAQQRVLERLSAIGADAFLVKPVNAEDVELVIRRTMKSRSRHPT